MQPPTCLDHGLHVLKLRSFLPNRALECGRDTQPYFGLRLVSKEVQHPAIQTKIEQHFARFYHQMKVRKPKGRQDSMRTVIQISRRVDTFLHEVAQNQGCESGSGLDPYSIGSVDPDPYSESGSGSRKAKMNHKSRQ
jgi:hypothetical protein